MYDNERVDEEGRGIPHSGNYVMKKHQIVICLLCCILPIASACAGTPASENAVPYTIAPESEMAIVPSQTQVSEFEEITGFMALNDECYNITPDFVADNSDYMIFKYSASTESFLMYDSEVYSIGTCFGGYGITSMALADLNRDGQYELYYTFSWGSGIHRSQIGYFEPVKKEVTVFDYELYDYDMMLTVNEAGDLCVNSAALDINSCVDFSVRPQDFLGAIVSKGDKAVLDID